MSSMLVGNARPKVRAGDYERCMALIVEFGGDKKTKAYLEELVASSAINDKARDDADAMVAEARRRDALAV